MDDTAQTPSNSYVNTYVPPSEAGGNVSPTGTIPQVHAAPAPTPSSVPSNPTPAPMPEPTSSTTSTPAAPASGSEPVSTNEEALEAQNIFDLLGVSQATDQEKEAFLDELQQVIWEDFIENDVQLLISEAELAEMQKVQTQTYPSDLEKQEALVVFLEKLIPDLENLMLDKALDLKRDMVMERIAGMKEYFAGQTDKLQEITKAEDLITQNKWRSAADILNKIV